MVIIGPNRRLHGFLHAVGQLLITGWSFESHDGPLLISGWFLQSHIEESIKFAWLPRDSTDQPVIIKDQPTALLHGGNREVA